jgi:hypothetical protein
MDEVLNSKANEAKSNLTIIKNVADILRGDNQISFKAREGIDVKEYNCDKKTIFTRNNSSSQELDLKIMPRKSTSKVSADRSARG